MQEDLNAEANEGGALEKSRGIRGLVLLLVLGALYFTHDLILPFTLALLINFVLRPPVRGLKRIRIPEPVGAGMIVLILLGCVVYGIITLSGPAAEWLTKAPGSLHKIAGKVGLLNTKVSGLNRAMDELNKMISVGAEKTPEVAVKGPGITGTVLSGTRHIVVKGSITFVLLYFLLSSGDLLLSRFVELSPNLSTKKRVVDIARAIESHISRYLFTITIINFTMGTCLATGMYIIGMPDPVLWGVMAGLLIYVPYIGPVVGILVVTTVAFLSFDSLGRVLMAPAIYIGLEVMQGYIVTPMILGARFQINPLIIVVWLIFWGWMWGIIGVIVAFPMLTAFKIFCDRTPGLAYYGRLIER